VVTTKKKSISKEMDFFAFTKGQKLVFCKGSECKALSSQTENDKKNKKNYYL